jgi:hypothetical protein
MFNQIGLVDMKNVDLLGQIDEKWEGYINKKR